MRQTVTYYFQHPEHTDNECEEIGEDHAEAKDTLVYEYGLEPEDIFNLMYEGHIWLGYNSQEGENR